MELRKLISIYYHNLLRNFRSFRLTHGKGYFCLTTGEVLPSLGYTSYVVVHQPTRGSVTT